MARRMVAAGCALALVLGLGGYLVLRGDDTRTVVAEFAYVNGVFPGSTVAVLGVPVGTVESVQPAGDVVRVQMTLHADVRLPAAVQSFVMNPSVISDRFVELSPAYQGGPELGRDAVIPVERNHSPIGWDQLMTSVNTIATALGPEGGDLGALLDRAAGVTHGLGPQVRVAVRNLSQATSLVAARSEDVGALIDNLNTVVTAFAARQTTVDALTTSLTQISAEVQRQDLDVGTPIAALRSLFDKLDQLLRDRGADVAVSLANARTAVSQLGIHQGDLAELVDLLPLMMQNLDRAITPDQRARIRLNISTTLAQLNSTAGQCVATTVPMCVGAGWTNPLPLPLSASDPLGIATALRGGR